MLKVLKENLFTLFTATLMLSALFLVFFNFNNSVQGADCDTCQGKVLNDTEVIYEKVECVDCDCRDVGNKLFAFFGTEADCDEHDNEHDRMACYEEHSYKEFLCGDLTGEKRDKCLRSFRAPSLDYNLGSAGTLVAREKIDIGGRRTYILGGDEKGESKIMTSTLEPDGEAIVMHESSRDVDIRGDLLIGGNRLHIQSDSSQSGIFFGAEPKYSWLEYADDYYGAQVSNKPEQASKNSLETLKYGNDKDILYNVNDYHLLREQIDIEKEAPWREKNRLVIEKGLKLEDGNSSAQRNVMLRIGSVFQGRELDWIGPIRGD